MNYNIKQETKIVRDKRISRAYDFVYSVTAETLTVIDICGKCKRFEGKLTFCPPLCIVPIFYTDITFSNEVEIEYTKVSDEDRKKLMFTYDQQFFQLNGQPFLAKKGVIFIGPVKKGSDWGIIQYSPSGSPEEFPLYGGPQAVYEDYSPLGSRRDSEYLYISGRDEVTTS